MYTHTTQLRQEGGGYMYTHTTQLRQEREEGTCIYTHTTQGRQEGGGYMYTHTTQLGLRKLCRHNFEHNNSLLVRGIMPA